ncbi:MAG TPA: multicopper oxidase domain-containing protein [Candidatus Angelobacter sp.]|jgi:FtsP/CotA-like multicopper oxidase with cupredoxin domain|nr:multicopper oxidase domain-containing protein [Candidatus Angelobacter sp.]
MSTPTRRKKKDVKPEPGEGLTRRTALKLGAAAGAVTVLTSRKGFSLPMLYDSVPPEPTVCSPQPAHSPGTTPFVQALPIPPIARPKKFSPVPTQSANIAAGEAPRADHQRWSEFLPQDLYEFTLTPALHTFHPDMAPTYVWTYNGIYPGPTIIGQYGIPSLVRFHNNLPVDHTGFGSNTHTTHLHNGHTASESDGFAGDFWGPGFFKDHHYPNIYAGYDTFPGGGDPREAMRTFWYHDHRHSFTATNNYRGLNGMFLLYDNVDTGFETGGDHNALHLPGQYGLYDIPLNFTDKKFCADGQMFATAPDAVPAGDKFIVNGAIQPFFQVARRKYRFRMLNSGPARIWTFTMSDGRPFTLIATDGNLLEHPVNVPSLELHVSSRYDVVLDFSGNQIGDSVYLMNIASQFVNNAPEPLPDPNVDVTKAVMRFDVVSNAQDQSVVPDTLIQYPDLNLNEVVTTRIWNFDLIGGQFKVNGLIFDPDRADATVKQGTAETWIIRNKLPASGWTHPVHIHLEEGRILSRNGAPPPSEESGRRDVYPIRPGEEVHIFLRFREWFGKYMIHCHNLGHEDNFMLVRWDVGTQTSLVTSPVDSLGNPNPLAQPNPNPPVLSDLFTRKGALA